jgi:hypothetical protein
LALALPFITFEQAPANDDICNAIDQSFFESDPQSDEVKYFANLISMIKSQLLVSNDEHLIVFAQATSLQQNINAYLEGTDVNVLPELPNDVLLAIETGDIEQLEKLVSDEMLNECFRIPYPSYTCLVVAIRADSKASAKYFIDRGADLEAYCKNKSPLMYTVQYGRTEILEYLLEKGANPNTSIEGKTALDFATKYENEEAAQFLRKATAK